jgi:uncharacterized protein (TIGR02284 family)
MSERTERDTLNTLIETCRDGARGFQLAADHVRSGDLKEFFANTALQREQFAAELLPYAQRLGGGQDADGTAVGALHRGWMMIKDAMTNYDEDAVMVEAGRGEAAAANAYAEAITAWLPPGVRPLIETQYQQILAAQREIEDLRLSRIAS